VKNLLVGPVTAMPQKPKARHIKVRDMSYLTDLSILFYCTITRLDLVEHHVLDIYLMLSVRVDSIGFLQCI
jgi:hypothetical protein